MFLNLNKVAHLTLENEGSALLAQQCNATYQKT